MLERVEHVAGKRGGVTSERDSMGRLLEKNDMLPFSKFLCWWPVGAVQ